MKKKIIIISFIISAFIAYFVSNFVMAAPDDISKAKVDLNINATNLADQFLKNDSIATKKYQEKILVVKGKITSSENNSITLDQKITCVFDNKIAVKKDAIVKIKGLFIGYDELLEEVKLNQCSILK